MASPNISFDQITASIRKPGKYFEFNTKLAVRTLPSNLQRVVLIGQRLTAGSVPALMPVDVFSDEQAATNFGAGSIAHLMSRAAITANPYAPLTVIAVDDHAEGIAATGTITLAGAVTSMGIATAYICDERVDVVVDSDATPTAVATALTAAVNAAQDLPVTATNAAGVITLKARHKGAAGNGIVVSASTTAKGLTVSVSGMSAGDLDPDLAPAFAAIFAAGYNLVALPFTTAESLGALRTHLEAVGSPMEQRDALGFAGWPGTLAAGGTLADDVNSGLISIAWHNDSVRSAGEIAAGYAAVVSSEEDPARPLNTLEIKGLDVTPVTSRPGRVEQENALNNGLTPLEGGPGNRVQIVRAITTYTQDAQGVADISLLDLTTMRTLHYARKALRERIALRFPREKLSSRTPKKVRSEILDVLYKMEELEIVEEVAANADGVVVERDSQDPNRLDAKIPVDVVNGLHVFAGRIDLLL
jgi:phage tail sheath gpL-like